MNKTVVALLLGLMLVPAVSFAQSAQPTSQQLQQLITALTLRVQALEAQLASLNKGQKASNTVQAEDNWTYCKNTDQKYRDQLADIEEASAQKEQAIYISSDSGKTRHSAITKLRKDLELKLDGLQDKHDKLRNECKDKGVRIEKLNVGANGSTCSYTLDKKGKLSRICA